MCQLNQTECHFVVVFLISFSFVVKVSKFQIKIGLGLQLHVTQFLQANIAFNFVCVSFLFVCGDLISHRFTHVASI